MTLRLVATLLGLAWQWPAARKLVGFFGAQFLDAPAPSDTPGSEHEIVKAHAQRAADQ